MSKRDIKNLPASIQDRLMSQARENDRPFNEVLQYFAIERFLYRLAQSQYSREFVLKGALLFRVWGLPAFRPTRDIDLLGNTVNEVDNLTNIIREVCKGNVQDDGMFFDPETVIGERIKEDADYEGVRIRFVGLLGKTRVHLQIDVGFADVVSPKPVQIKYPVILPFPEPELRSYPPESVVAEKFQAMIYGQCLISLIFLETCSKKRFEKHLPTESPIFLKNSQLCFLNSLPGISKCSGLHF